MELSQKLEQLIEKSVEKKEIAGWIRFLQRNS